jgi:hypothetical protein
MSKAIATVVAGLLLALGAGLGVVAARAPQVTDQMAFLPDTAEVRRFLEINARYHNFDTLLVGVEAPDVLAPSTLGKLRDVSVAIGKVAGVSWMSSLATVPDMKPSEEGVVVEPILPANLPTAAADIEALRTRIRGNRSVMGNLVNADFTAALIVVTPYGDQVSAVAPRVEEIARAAAGPDFQPVFHGAPAVELFLARGGAAIPPYGVAAGLLFLGVLLVGLGPRRLPAWLLVVAPAAAAGLATPVLLGFPASRLSMASGLGAFVFGSLVVFSAPGAEPAAWRRWWMRLLVVSVGLAGVFASLAASPVVPLRGLGMGFAAAALAVGLLGPLGLAAGRALTGGAPAAAGSAHPRWGWFAALVPIALAAGVALTAPAPSAENDLAATFGARSGPAQAVRFLDGRFGGSDFVTVVLDGDFANPAFLRAADDLAAAFRQVPGVADVTSPTDIFKMISEAMIGHYRIPDTVEQMQALWFFLEGQPELSALLYQREQGLMQLRLTPEASTRKQEVLAGLQRAIDAIPRRVAIADLRQASEADAARLRAARVARVVARLAARLGEGTEPVLATTLGAIAPLELRPASAAPDPRVQAAWRERLAGGLQGALVPWLTEGNGPVTLTPEQAPALLQALLADAGPPEERGRDGVERLLAAWFPADAELMPRVGGAALDKAREVQDRALRALLADELAAAGRSEARLDGEALGFLRDVVSPYVTAVAQGESAPLASETGAAFELTGYPAIAPVLAAVAFADLARAGAAALLVLLALALLAALFRGPDCAARVRVALLAGLGALAWQVLWLKGHAWALDVSSFLAGAMALAAAGGAGLLALAGRSGRDHLAAALLTAGPLLVLSLCPFVPVGTVMGLSGMGVAGAALNGWLAGSGKMATTNRKEETR